MGRQQRQRWGRTGHGREEDVITKSVNSASPGDRPARTRGRPLNPERRDAILDAAVKLFGEKGYRGTGLHALAKEVGITHAGILHHFGTKEALLHALIEYRFQQESAAYVPILTAGGRAGLALIPGLAERLLADATFERLFTVLIAENLSAGEPLHDHFVSAQRVGRQVVATMIRTGIDRGEFRDDVDPELVATEIIAFTIGMQNQYLLDPDSVRLVDTYRHYTNDLIARLTPS
jgi:AcrR family transcriptional regulator